MFSVLLSLFVESKNQWARDDPAFLVLLSLCLCGKCIIFYGHGFSMNSYSPNKLGLLAL